MASIEISYICINGKYYKVTKTIRRGYAESQSISSHIEEVDYNDIKEELINNEIRSRSN